LEQVLLNLIKNSIQAIKEVKNPFVKIYGFINTEERLQIDIIDNGIGIPEEISDKIFVPFYSTKKEGSGIGLSVARYIMQLHGGQLNVNTSTGKTIFSLVF
ncbi:GHKL domain-containing protein, partial [Candidatus Woesearchaeota archaeon]|nr:GHKL domain-containing protein [Candidatus Woesearchaeota archaeon]